jgi:hypothetical protein
MTPDWCFAACPSHAIRAGKPKTRKALLRVLSLLSVALLWCQPSAASLVQSINSPLGSGQVEFADPVGGDETDIVAFTFTWLDVGGIRDVTFGLADITSASYAFSAPWIIDTATFDLRAEQLNVPDFDAVFLGFAANNVVHASFVLPGSPSVIGGTNSYTLSPVHVPEPWSITLFAVGVAGLGLLLWRQRRAL